MSAQASGLAKILGPLQAPDIVKVWLEGKSDDTLKSYAFDLRRFARFIGVSPDDLGGAASALFSCNQGDANGLVFRFRNHLISEGLAAASVNRHLASLTSLAKVARMVGLVPWTLDVPRMKVEPYRDTRGPGRDGFLKLMAALEGRADATSVRNRVVLRLLYERGLRIKEVLGLRIEDLDVPGRRIAILGKGRRSREWVTLAHTTVAALVEWVRVRGEEPGALFCRLHTSGMSYGLKPLSRQGGYRIVRLLGESIGIRARPHGLRHSAITAALDAGADVRAVQRFSRHKNIQTVLMYDDNRRDMGGEVASLISEPAPPPRRWRVTSIIDMLNGRNPPRKVWTTVQPPPELFGRCGR